MQAMKFLTLFKLWQILHKSFRFAWRPISFETKPAKRLKGIISIMIETDMTFETTHDMFSMWLIKMKI